MADSDEIFESAVSATGDLAGVFEYDGETSYFYLYRTGEGDNTVIDAVHLLSGSPDFSGADIEIRWTSDQVKVGLFIRGELWAVFDVQRGAKDGGNYRPQARSQISEKSREGFAFSS